MTNPVGVRYTKSWRAWTAEEDATLISNVGAISMLRIAKMLGRTPTALKLRATTLGIRPLHEATIQAGMTVPMVAIALGVVETTVRRWVHCGWLKANYGVVYRRRCITIDADELSRFLFAFGALLEDVEASDAIWLQEVECARKSLNRRYIDSASLLAALGMADTKTLTWLRRMHGLPEPLQLGGRNGNWYDREQVRAWSREHPQYRLVEVI